MFNDLLLILFQVVSNHSVLTKNLHEIDIDLHHWLLLKVFR